MNDDEPSAWRVWLLAREITAVIVWRWFVEVPLEYARALWRWLTKKPEDE